MMRIKMRRVTWIPKSPPQNAPRQKNFLIQPAEHQTLNLLKILL